MKDRRRFIRDFSLAGLTAAFVPSLTSLASTGKAVKQDLNKGAVILFQGDSITDGNRGRSQDPNHIMGHGYAFNIASRLGADYPQKHYNFYNRGISGNKIFDLENRWQSDTLDLKPDILSIMIGVNDSSSVVLNWPPLSTLEIFEDKYDALLRLTKTQLPEALLVLCEPFILKVGNVRDHWEAYHSDIVTRQAIVSGLALKYNAVFVGLQSVFENACLKAEAPYWIWDGVHPTVAGHELITREWLRKVSERISF